MSSCSHKHCRNSRSHVKLGLPAMFQIPRQKTLTSKISIDKLSTGSCTYTLVSGYSWTLSNNGPTIRKFMVVVKSHRFPAIGKPSSHLIGPYTEALNWEKDRLNSKALLYYCPIVSLDRWHGYQMMNSKP